MSSQCRSRSLSAAMSRDEVREIVTLFERHINRGQVRYLRAGHLDVMESQRHGVHFTDPISGRRLIDCFSSAGSFNVSRHNPLVVKALEEALETYDMGAFDRLSEAKILLAEKLLAMAPQGLRRIRFAAGGGDAVDCAIKMARGATGRSKILATVKAYHGHTGFALSANGKQHYRHYCEPLMPGFEFVPFNDLAAMSERADAGTAAIIIEPVQGEAGIFVGSDEYLKGLRRICDERGIVLIFDEIQTGFGRTGRLFACQHSGVSPDIMTVAKSMGGGIFTNAAVLFRDSGILTDFVENNPDFHVSFDGGSDLGCRVSLKVLEYIESMRLWENAEKMGSRLRGALNELREANPKIIKEVRGIGLMVGIEYIHEFMGPMMSDALARHGVFAAYSGNAPQVMRFMAPITISDSEMDALIDAVRGAIKDMKTLLPLALPAAKIPGVLKLLNNERFQTSLFGALRKIEDGAKAVGGMLGRK